MQQTLGIAPLNSKSDILLKISKEKNVKIVYQKRFELTIEIAKQVLVKDIKEQHQQTVFGFILEGPNAVANWLDIIRNEKNLIFHGSVNPTHAQTETDWFQHFDSSIKSNNSSTSTSSSSSSIPVKITGRKNNLIKKTTTKTSVSGTSQQTKKVGSRGDTAVASSGDGPRTTLKKPIVRSKIPNAKTTPASAKDSVTAKAATAHATTKATTTASKAGTRVPTSTAASRKTSRVSSTASPEAISTAKISTTTKVSKIAPLSSGRARKTSKLTEKKPVTSTVVIPKIDEPHKEKIVEAKEEDLSNDINTDTSESNQTEIQQQVEGKVDVVDEAIAVEEAPVIQQEVHREDQAIPFDEPTEEEDEEMMTLIQQPISHPSTCSSADEHDAEVAATTSNKNTNSSNVRATAYVLQNSGRSSSFSPGSVSSLPRPETPEVDQLRLRFENIIQTSSPGSDAQLVRRPSSKPSPEFISRIKEMKPKGPVGSKVKSMVDLFMDENLNKWEF